MYSAVKEKYYLLRPFLKVHFICTKEKAHRKKNKAGDFFSLWERGHRNAKVHQGQWNVDNIDSS